MYDTTIRFNYVQVFKRAPDDNEIVSTSTMPMSFNNRDTYNTWLSIVGPGIISMNKALDVVPTFTVTRYILPLPIHGGKKDV
jgi:hypothetical protein